MAEKDLECRERNLRWTNFINLKSNKNQESFNFESVDFEKHD